MTYSERRKFRLKPLYSMKTGQYRTIPMYGRIYILQRPFSVLTARAVTEKPEVKSFQFNIKKANIYWSLLNVNILHFINTSEIQGELS